MRLRISAMILLAAMTISSSPVTNASSELKLWNCYNESLGEEVTCGTFEVMENRQVRKGAKIQIHFLILPARTSNPAPDPVFVFDGGPGAGAASFPTSWAQYCDRVREEREVVLIDQRGTGQSQPLPCRRLGDPQGGQTYLQEMFPESYVQECRRVLEEKASLYYYHAMMAMPDYDDLREALGYSQINILGGSYGSYFGLIYMKMYPERVRSAFLFSIALPHLLYPADLARDTQNSLERLLADCAADPDCARDYPQLSSQLNRVLIRLENRLATITINNPINGQRQTVRFHHYNFIHGLRSMLYSPNSAQWIPAFIHWADQGNYAPIAEYTISYEYWTNQTIMDGMFLCVTCSETIPFIDFRTARARAQGTMMGTYRLDQQRRACTLWVRGSVPAGFHDLVPLNIPALLVNGENDPATPPQNAEILSQYLGDSAVVIIPNARHGIGVVMEGCLDEVIARFYAQASVSGLDFSCVSAYERPPFVSWRDVADPESLTIRHGLQSDGSMASGDPGQPRLIIEK